MTRLLYQSIVLTVLLFSLSCTSTNTVESAECLPEIRSKEINSICILKNNKNFVISTWNPEPNQLPQIIKVALTFLKISKPGIYEKINKYHAQVVGIGKSKKNMVHLNFYCDESKAFSYVDVFDGGNCYFSMDVQFLENKISNFLLNGEA